MYNYQKFLFGFYRRLKSHVIEIGKRDLPRHPPASNGLLPNIIEIGKPDLPGHPPASNGPLRVLNSQNADDSTPITDSVNMSEVEAHFYSYRPSSGPWFMGVLKYNIIIN